MNSQPNFDLRTRFGPAEKAGWTRTPLKVLLREVDDRAGDRDFELLSLSRDRGVERRRDQAQRASEASSYAGYKVVRRGDLVSNKMQAWNGIFGVSSFDGMTSPDYAVYEFVNRSCWPAFVERVLRTQLYASEFLLRSRGMGTGFLRLNPPAFLSTSVWLPDLDTQKAVAEFLDKETARIDQLIEKKQRLVELLEERFDMQVRVATTRGRPDAHELVESGVPYLGKLPADWPVEKTGWRYSVQLGKMLDGAKQTGKHLAPYLRVADVQWGEINTAALPSMDFSVADRAKFRLEPGDLIVNEGGSYVGRSAIWRGELVDCFYQKALHRLRPRDPSRDTSEYFLWVMWFATRSGVFIANGNQTTIDHLTAEAFKKYRFAFPPIDEQRQIADTLKRSRQKVGGLTASVQASIDRLKEYRSALITAAVTGQIDVTRWGQTGEGDKRLDQIQEEMAG